MNQSDNQLCVSFYWWDGDFVTFGGKLRIQRLAITFEAAFESIIELAPPIRLTINTS